MASFESEERIPSCGAKDGTAAVDFVSEFVPAGTVVGNASSTLTGFFLSDERAAMEN